MDYAGSGPTASDEAAVPSGWWHLRPRARTILLTLAPAAVALFVFAHALNPSFVEWFQARVGFQWLGVAGLMIVCFTGGYTAAQYQFPEVRAFAFALVFAAIYMLDITAGYSHNTTHARLVSELSWWAIPIFVATWTSATFGIADAVGLPEVAVPTRTTFWERMKPRSLKEWLIWGAALVFSTVGSWPGLGLTVDRSKPPNWNGYAYSIHPLYFAFVAFALTALLTSAVVMDRAWRMRPPWISKSRAEYGSTTRLSAWALFAVAGLLLATAAKIWPEALIDALLAIYVYWFLMRIISTHHYSDLRAATSLRRRTSGGAAIILILFTGIVASGLPTTRAAVIGAVVAGAWPLIPTTDRALHGRRRIWRSRANAGVSSVEAIVTASNTPVSSKAIAGEVDFAREATTSVLPDSPVAVAVASPQTLSRAELSELTTLLVDEAWPSETLVSPARRLELAVATHAELALLSTLKHPVRELVDMIGRDASWSEASTEVYAFLDVFSPIQPVAEGLKLEARIQALSRAMLELVRVAVAARRTTLQDGRSPRSKLKGDPDPYLLLETECAERLCGEEKSDPLRMQYYAMLSANRSWREGLGWLTPDAAKARSKAQLERGLRPGERILRTDKKSTQGVRRRRIDEAGAVLLDSWRRDLERAAATPGSHPATSASEG